MANEADISLRRLFSAAFDGRLEVDQWDQLAELLLRDDQGRQQYIKFIQMQADLCLLVRAADERGSAPQDTVAR